MLWLDVTDAVRATAGLMRHLHRYQEPKYITSQLAPSRVAVGVAVGAMMDEVAAMIPMLPWRAWAGITLGLGMRHS